VAPKYAPDAMAGVHKLKVKLLHVSFFSMRILKISTRDVREAALARREAQLFPLRYFSG
jgi:hypothetical protein